MKSRQPRARRRRIAVVTGTRAEYGLLRSCMEAIARHPQLTLQLVATGTHLLRKFGSTVNDIIRDGWQVDARVRMQKGDDSPTDQAQGLGRGIAGIAHFLEEARTDIVLVLGDRIEALAGALAAVTTGRLLAHLHGGEIAPGDFDDPVRHALTKLAHLHLTATAQAQRRVLRMGEEARRVQLVGAPGLDDLLRLAREYGKPPGPSGKALIVQHACGRSAAHEQRVMSALLRAVTEAQLKRVIIFPNSDRGHTGVLKAIAAHQRQCARDEVRVIRSLPRAAYLQELLEAEVLVGNSSSGLLEAPTAGTPAVNIGPRQQGRERGGRAVIDAGESFASISEKLAAARRKRPKIGGTTPYGDGKAGARTATHLAQVPLDAAFRTKRNVY